MNHHGIQGGGGVRAVVGIDPGKVGLHQLNGGGLAGLECSTQLRNGNFGYFDHVVIASCKWRE